MSNAEKRVRKLEQASYGAGIVGIQYPGEPVTAGSEKMTRGEFYRRYPDGQLIEVIYSDPSPNSSKDDTEA